MRMEMFGDGMFEPTKEKKQGDKLLSYVWELTVGDSSF